MLALIVTWLPVLQAYIIAKSSPFSHTDDLEALKQVMKDVKYLKAVKKVCRPVDYGSVYGAHKLCTLFPEERFPCHFLSFGIEKDYSFDETLYKRHNCSGVAYDPTVSLPEQLFPGVRFVRAGANSPVQRQHEKYLSVPKIRKGCGHPIFALKMDCEGCEYSLAPDILADDPNFFLSVLQFNFEVHLPRSFAHRDEDIYNLGRLFRLIYLSGMRLVHVDDGRCGPKDQELGCHDLLGSIGFPCVPGCRSYLFAHNYPNAKVWREGYDRTQARTVTWLVLSRTIVRSVPSNMQ
jgi:hypothetical protein